MKCKKILKTIKYKTGYIVKHELISGTEYGCKDTIMKNAYNLNGDYIGNSKSAYHIVKKRGIIPEKALPTHNTCSIGFCKKENKWYGWSHRAMYGFGIGHVTKKGNCECSTGWTDEYLKKHPEMDTRMPINFKVKTLEDAKKCAIAFAESVS